MAGQLAEKMGQVYKFIQTCPYCNGPVELSSGADLYPHRPDLSKKRFYWCRPCDAYVGCHGDTTKPLGTMANTELRWHRKKLHAIFDPVWKSGLVSRTQAYECLATRLGISMRDCHIAMFDLDTCRRAIKICETTIPNTW